MSSVTQKALHGGSLVGLIVAVVPLFQTMWTEKPWWAETEGAASSVERDIAVEGPVPKGGQQVAIEPVLEQAPQSAAPQEARDIFSWELSLAAVLMSAALSGTAFYLKRRYTAADTNQEVA